MKVKIQSISLTDKELDYISDALIFLERSYKQLLIDEPEDYSETDIDIICHEIRKVSELVDYLIDYGQILVSLESDEMGE